MSAGKPSTAVVLTHSQPGDTHEALGEAARAAVTAGWRLVAPADEASKHEQPDGVEFLDEVPRDPDLCLVLGGDGTILRALSMFAGKDVPVFAINFGTIGFLAAVDRDELGEGLEKAFAREFEVMSMPGLDVDAAGATLTALNDVTVIRRPHSRVAELSYRLGGKEVGHVRCDGLVAATPAGSTGYNLANNGPILAWGVEGYVVSFIAPHTLTARALVVAPSDPLSIDNAGGRDTVDVAIDGVKSADLESGGSLEIRFRNDVATLAQLEGSNFYRRVREKFGRIAR